MYKYLIFFYPINSLIINNIAILYCMNNKDLIKNRYYAGIGTGVASTLVFHPIDIIRIRLFFGKKKYGIF